MSLHLQKLLTFFNKNTCEFGIVLTRPFNILTINELVKLTTLWTTRPWCLFTSGIFFIFVLFVLILTFGRGSNIVIISLRKHAYSNILKISPQKKWKFSDKISDIFHISAQNIGCGHLLEPPRGGGSNKYPQNMFLSRNKNKHVYSCKPQFYYINLGFKGSTL